MDFKARAICDKYSLHAMHVLSLMLPILLQSYQHVNGNTMRILLTVNYVQSAGSNTTTKIQSLAGV